MAIAWPKVITDKGGVRNPFHHMIDIAPTILEATHIAEPALVDGVRQSPMEVSAEDEKRLSAAERNNKVSE